MNAPNQTVTASGILGWDGQKGRVVEFGFASSGESFSASHNISQDKWTSPNQGKILVDGEFTKEKSLRTFKFDSTDRWRIITEKRMLEGEPQPDMVSTYTRK